MQATIRKVVDTNQLRNPALTEYLSRSQHHFAVLCDYTAMEAYKPGVDKAFDLLHFLCEYPQQVLVLKGTQRVCRLSGRLADLQRRLIDSRQTTGFAQFCRDLRAAHDGDERFRRQLVAHWQESRHFLDEVLIPDCEDLLLRLDTTVRGTFTHDEIRKLRGPTFDINRNIAEKIITSIFLLAANLFALNRGTRWPANVPCFRNVYPFRFALCMYAYTLDWISTGSNVKAATRNVRNDLVDVGVTAYATYFDGLLSRDGKATRIYDHADAILRTVLGPPFSGAKRDWLERLLREAKAIAKGRYAVARETDTEA